MKTFLMFPDRDVDPEADLPPHADALTQDLELTTLWGAMAEGDAFVYEVARRGVLDGLVDPETIRYRQRVLADCLEHPDVVAEMYEVAVEAIQREKREFFGLFRSSPESILSRSVKVLRMFVELLTRLRGIADQHADSFTSPGFTRLFGMLATELDDEYFRQIDTVLGELALRRGMLASARLGTGLKATDYVLRERPDRGWRERLPFGGPASYSFLVPARDEAGFRALMDLHNRGLNQVANAAAQSADHILSFFVMLRTELAFYLGGVNLRRRLSDIGVPTCFPEPVTDARRTCRELRDVCLALRVRDTVTGNDVDASGTSLVMITGANQGGKSTFLRSVGVAQLMAQAGLFVTAEQFTAPVHTGVFTHFRREEDTDMQSGKLDEELARMSTLADHIAPGGLVLCNESFAATNEREGSQIARQVVRAFTDSGVTVFFVTHLFDLAHGFYGQRSESVLFLRAQRLPDGQRTFRVVPGEPLPTSHGADSYRRIFGVPANVTPSKGTATTGQ